MATGIVGSGVGPPSGAKTVAAGVAPLVGAGAVGSGVM